MTVEPSELTLANVERFSILAKTLSYENYLRNVVDGGTALSYKNGVRRCLIEFYNSGEVWIMLYERFSVKKPEIHEVKNNPECYSNLVKEIKFYLGEP